MEPQITKTGEERGLTIINLSSRELTEGERQVLMLGLSFCPNHNMDRFETIKDIHLFARNLLFRSMYAKRPITREVDSGLTAVEFRAIRDLNLLLQEGGLDDIMDPEDHVYPEEDSEKESQRQTIIKFIKKSQKFPSLSQDPAIALFVRQTTKDIEMLWNKENIDNLTPEQHKSLRSLQNNDTITIKPSNKGGQYSSNGQRTLQGNVFENLGE